MTGRRPNSISGEAELNASRQGAFRDDRSEGDHGGDVEPALRCAGAHRGTQRRPAALRKLNMISSETRMLGQRSSKVPNEQAASRQVLYGQVKTGMLCFPIPRTLRF